MVVLKRNHWIGIGAGIAAVVVVSALIAVFARGGTISSSYAYKITVVTSRTGFQQTGRMTVGFRYGSRLHDVTLSPGFQTLAPGRAYSYAANVPTDIGRVSGVDFIWVSQNSIFPNTYYIDIDRVILEPQYITNARTRRSRTIAYRGANNIPNGVRFSFRIRTNP